MAWSAFQFLARFRAVEQGFALFAAKSNQVASITVLQSSYGSIDYILADDTLNLIGEVIAKKCIVGSWIESMLQRRQ